MCFCTCLMDRLLWVGINCMFLTCSSARICGSEWMYLGLLVSLPKGLGTSLWNCFCHGVMTLSTLLWLKEWTLISLCLFWPVANNFQLIEHLTVEGCLCECSCEVHSLSNVFTFTPGTWSLYITEWLQRINARIFFLYEMNMAQNWPGHPLWTVESVMVISSAFLWLIPSGQSMCLFKMEKRAHCASKVSSKSCPPGLMRRNCVVCQYFTAEYPHSALEHSPVLPSWLLCNAQYIFATGARAQQLHHSSRGNFECLLHLSSVGIKAFNKLYTAQLTHTCNTDLLWTLIP